jgi:hypothetical protein
MIFNVQLASPIDKKPLRLLNVHYAISMSAMSGLSLSCSLSLALAEANIPHVAG